MRPLSSPGSMRQRNPRPGRVGAFKLGLALVLAGLTSTLGAAAQLDPRQGSTALMIMFLSLGPIALLCGVFFFRLGMGWIGTLWDEFRSVRVLYLGGFLLYWGLFLSFAALDQLDSHRKQVNVPILILFALTGPPLLVTSLPMIGATFRRRTYMNPLRRICDVPVEATILPDTDSESRHH